MSPQQQEYIRKLSLYKKKVLLYQYSIFLLFLSLWELAANYNLINAFIFSSPSRMAKAVYALFSKYALLHHIGITLAETIISFVLVILISIITATLLWLFTTAKDICEPYLVVFNSLPKSALAPVIIVWLGTGMKSIIITAMSVAIFGTIINIYTGFAQTDPEKMKLIRTLGGSKWDILTKLIFPDSIALIFSTMRVNIGLCLVGVIIAEFLVANSGIGYIIIYSSQTFKLDWVMTSICILCLMAILLYKMVSLLEKHILRKFMG